MITRMTKSGGSRAASAGGAASESAPPLRVALVREAGDWSAFADADRTVERAAAALAGHPACRLLGPREASIVLGNDALISRLNSTYRGKQGATNVLAFPYQKPRASVAEDYLGDVVLAAETVAREAAERGISPNAHLQHLVVHGLLHLLGHGHENDAEAERMEALESAILAATGVADPHALRG
jgi:probable rRNA maturation factor